MLIEVHPDRCLEHWARAAGVGLDRLDARFAHDDAHARFERGEMPFAGYAEHLRRTLGLDLDDGTLEAGWNAMLGDTLPGAADAITAAAAYGHCFVFSNSNAAHQAVWSRAHAELLAPLRGVFVSSEIGARKPEARAFRSVADAIGVPPRNILFFDDLGENVAAARAVGYQAVQVGGPGDVLAILG